MSDCTITIKIGDKEIRLDPGANISAKDPMALANTIPADKLRSLYGQLKESLTLKPVLTSHDKDLVNTGKAYYEELLQSTDGDNFLTILKAINTEKDPDNIAALSAYAKTLDPRQVLDHGNFKIDPKDSYKSSPYTSEQIRKMVFKSDGDKVKLFDELRKLPGMETLKMSIAYATEWYDPSVEVADSLAEPLRKPKLDRVKGAYISPDNIVQIVVPYKKKGYHTVGSEVTIPNVTEKNIGDIAKSETQDVLIHELMHAVYSELYRSEGAFRDKIDMIHDRLLDDLEKKNKDVLYKKYTDVHEFIASVFNDPKLSDALSKVPMNTQIDLTLFDAFTGVLDERITKPSLLRDYIATIGAPITNISSQNQVDLTALQEALKDDRNVFYIDGIDAEEEDEHMAPRDQTDSYYGNNRKAFYSNQRFQNKWNNGSFVRDSYYKGTISDPTAQQVDLVNSDDVVLVPWLRYIKAERNGKKIIKPGRWQEVGLVVTDDDKEVKGKNGKPRIEAIIRNEKGVIQKTADGYKLKEMTQGFPVMYANMDKRQVVVAKTNLKISDEFNTNDKFNTVSFPYELIKGIRTLDREYFDHNIDYLTQLNDAERELAKIEKAKERISSNPNETGVEKIFDEYEFYINRVKNLKTSVEKAEAIREDMKQLYKSYAFTHEEDGKIYMNVPKADYVGSSYTKDRMEDRVFAQFPVFLLRKGKYKTKDNKDKYYTQPDFRMFDIFWDDSVGKEYAKSSEQISEAVSKGDLVRVRTLNEFKVLNSNEKVKVRMGEWMTVYGRVANGILAATKDGKGFIIPFNTVDAYAKNKTTSQYSKMVETYKAQLKDFDDDAFTTVVENGKSKWKFSKEITHKSLQYNEKFNRRKGENGEFIEGEEESVKRFEGNLERIRKLIKPGESFVRLGKRFVNDVNEVINYNVNALVLAKTDDALVVLTESKAGVAIIETIKYDSQIGATDRSGTQIMFYMENSANIKRAYDEFAKERGQYEINKKTANFSKDKAGNYSMLNDPRDNPHNIYSAYDFYEKVNGKTLQQLGVSGGIVDIKSDKFKLVNKYGDRVPIYRKVIRVLDDGTVVVAEYADKAVTFESGYTRPAGKAYARYVKPENIARIGLNIGTVSKDPETQEYHSSQNEELLNRRKWLWERSKVDREFTNFTFAKDQSSIRSLNNKPIPKDRDYWKFIPLTNKILEPQSKEDKAAGKVDDRPTVYLDKKFNEVSSDKAAYVMATYHKNSETLRYVNRGLMATTKSIGKKLALTQTKFGIRFHPELLKVLKPGDWITTIDKNGDYWDAVVERVEGGNVYTLNTDMTTSKVNPKKLSSVRMSNRNERHSGFTRTDRLVAKLKNVAQTKDAKDSFKAAKDDANKPDTEQTDDDDLSYSLEASYKSPKSSRRALYEIGNRLKELNPQIDLNYVDNSEISNLANMTGHDYSRARAFVLQGKVFINTDKASISDAVHEYAHLFLHTLKYESPEMYKALVSITNNHSLYNNIAQDYIHLDETDLSEEVFVTVLGEYLHNKLLPNDFENMNNNQGLLLDFAKYTKEKLSAAFNKQVDSIYDLDPTEVFNLSWEDAINLVGDQIMNSRITDVHKVYPLQTTKSIRKIREDLGKQGYLTQEC